MFSKPAHKINPNPWGNDNPEKDKQSSPPPKTIGFKDQIKGFTNTDSIWKQFFGEKTQLEKSQPISEKKPSKHTETLIFSYSKNTEQKKMVQESQIILQKLQEQITLLEKSEKNLAHEVSKVKIDTLPAKSGIYYIHFLEWLLTVVKQLRLKVEDGRAWLSTFSQRKKKRMGYWKMYKKHGTTFGLSQERTLATQTG